MTEADDEVVNNALEAMKEHNRLMEELTQKYIGKAALKHGRAFPDLFFRKEWYVNRIYDLGVWEGMNEMRQRRCKSITSKLYQKYQTVIQELRHVRGVLAALVTAH